MSKERKLESDRSHLKTGLFEPQSTAEEQGRLRLLVIGDWGSTTYPVTPGAALSIGRSAENDVPVDDLGVSRRHAILHIGETIAIEDLGSANGTLLGSRRIDPNRPVAVAVGEVVTVGATMMILQSSSAAARPHRVLSHGYFEARLEEECARARRDGRGFAVLRLRAATADAMRALEQNLGGVLGPGDVLGGYADRQYEVLLADAGAEEADAKARRLTLPGVRVGVATYPRDGRTGEALIASAGRNLAGATTVDAAAPDIVEGGALARMRPILNRVAGGTINVMIYGETGVGKDVLATLLHRLSPRASKSFLTLNCAALSESLLESELFGHERGAFTGAVQAKPGLLETADAGTVFLDEIGEMPLTIQAKLLRVIESRAVLRVGALKPRTIDVRFLAATNRDLEAEVQAGRFRQDLFFRLNGIALVMPPLRERTDEIEPLARSFVVSACRQAQREDLPALSPEALRLFKQFSWPGNIRELKNVIDRAVLLCAGDTITLEHLPRETMGPTLPRRSVVEPATRAGVSPTMSAARAASAGLPTPSAMSPIEASQTMPIPLIPVPESEPATDERKRILEALEQCAGNQTRAAQLLGISRRTLVSRLETYALPRPRKRLETE